MVGQGALRSSLLDPEVKKVLVVGRTPTGVAHDKLSEVLVDDLHDLSTVDLTGYDACFFCLGVSAAGMSEAAYRKVTVDLTLSIARTLAAQSPQMTFIYVSGTGTGGRAMWARVKGETERALQELPFAKSFMFRPAFIQPVHGARSKTCWYRVVYAVTAPLYPVWRALLPQFVTTNEAVANAMLIVAKRGAGKPILENADINALVASPELRAASAAS